MKNFKDSQLESKEHHFTYAMVFCDSVVLTIRKTKQIKLMDIFSMPHIKKQHMIHTIKHFQLIQEACLIPCSAPSVDGKLKHQI